MRNFIFHIPTKVIFGVGKVNKLSQYLPEDLKRMMIVTDGVILEKTDIINKVRNEIPEDCEITIYSNVIENPTFELVDVGGLLAKRKKIQMILGVGGGSSMDAAKGIALLATNRFEIKRYVKGSDLENNPLPLIAVPTTSGTGSEVTPFAVFSDTAEKIKCGYSHEGIFPYITIIDPSLTYSMPENVVINTGLDVLAHSIEAFLSTESFALNDQYAIIAIETVIKHLKTASRKEQKSMNALSYASMLAGVAITHSSTILPHIMGYPLTVFHNIPHGLASILTIPAFLEFLDEKNISNVRLNKIKELLGGNNNLKSFLTELGVKIKLSEYGIVKSELEDFTQKTIVKDDMKITPGNIKFNDVLSIYQKSL